MTMHRIFSVVPNAQPRASAGGIANLYDRAGDDYLTYADGDPGHLFSFTGLHGYADRRLWSVIDEQLRGVRLTGQTSLSVLDAGCGPGTWLRRLVTRARLLGFTEITARGFDVARSQIRTARRLASDLAELPGATISFEVADLMDRLPEEAGSVDLTLCLYSVLGHLPEAKLPRVAAEIARVTRGPLVATVRAIGSPPTVFVASIDKAREFRLNHDLGRCEVEFRNGRRMTLDFHLFTPAALREHFSPYFDIDVSGLDIFHTRFGADPRWNPECLTPDQRLLDRLALLEATFAREPGFIERATHLMLIGRRLPPPPALAVDSHYPLS